MVQTLALFALHYWPEQIMKKMDENENIASRNIIAGTFSLRSPYSNAKFSILSEVSFRRLIGFYLNVNTANVFAFCLNA